MKSVILDENGKPLSGRKSNLRKWKAYVKSEWHTWIPILISFLALLVSFKSASFSYQKNQITQKLAHLHIDPNVDIKYDLPVTGNPVFLVMNNGDTEIKALSVRHSVYIYNKRLDKIMSAVKAGYKLSDRMIYKEVLLPTEYATAELVDVNTPNENVSVYVFDVSYYRTEDMKQYGSHELFFIEDRKVITDSEYRKRSNYRQIIKSIENVIFPTQENSPGQLKSTLGLLDTINNKEESAP